MEIQTRYPDYWLTKRGEKVSITELSNEQLKNIIDSLHKAGYVSFEHTTFYMGRDDSVAKRTPEVTLDALENELRRRQSHS